MSILILGLVIFLLAHSLRLVAEGFRLRMIERIGVRAWKGIIAVTSIIGFVVIIWGFGLARQQPMPLYAPPMWLRHVNALFTLIAFVLFFSSYGPGNHFKAAVGHPMMLSVAVWSFGHLLSTGMRRDLVLFGVFLVWSVIGFAVSRRRDRLTGTTYPAGTLKGDAIAIVIGVVAWAAFAFWLHQRWIGVAPFG